MKNKSSLSSNIIATSSPPCEEFLTGIRCWDDTKGTSPTIPLKSFPKVVFSVGLEQRQILPTPLG